MSGIIVYESGGEYSHLRIMRVEGHKATLALMGDSVNIIGEVISPQEERLDILEAVIKDVLMEVNGQPIPIKEREYMIKSKFLEARL